jgi:glycosyltransferase involved in cell wall biosynthesis
MNTDKPLISVIIPVYKTEKYLKTCVESVCESDYKNLQIILVDDGSPDKCPEMCDELALGDSRIEVIHKENGGLSDARNAALDIAQGNYVTFIDSDDLIKKDMISDMYDIAVKENCDIVKTGMIMTEDEKDEGVNGDYIVVDKRQALGRIYTDPPSIVTICGKLFKLSLFDGLRFPVGMLNEDEYLTPRLFYRCERIALSEKTGYLYMQRPDESIMRSGFSPKKMVILSIVEDRTRLFESWGYKELVQLSERDNFVHLLLLREKTKNTEYKEQYDLIIKKIDKIRFLQLSTGQKIRYILLKLHLYDFVFRRKVHA